ncbi:MAG: hypothetical protein ACTS4W_01760 [Candidatus Hodgkinia cicadicola]
MRPQGYFKPSKRGGTPSQWPKWRALSSQTTLSERLCLRSRPFQPSRLASASKVPKLNTFPNFRNFPNFTSAVKQRPPLSQSFTTSGGRFHPCESAEHKLTTSVLRSNIARVYVKRSKLTSAEDI